MAATLERANIELRHLLVRCPTLSARIGLRRLSKPSGA